MEFKGLRPLFIVKPNTMSRKDIGRAERMAGICIVECAEPDVCRFLEPPPRAWVVKKDIAAKIRKCAARASTRIVLPCLGLLSQSDEPGGKHQHSFTCKICGLVPREIETILSTLLDKAVADGKPIILSWEVAKGLVGEARASTGTAGKK